MIDFIKAQFGMDKLIYNDVVDFFLTPKKESTSLEFKSNNGEKKIPDRIYQTICAMLNSEGGLIVWGAPTEKTNNEGEKECFGDLTPFSAKMRKEDLMRSVSDRIIPIPNNIEVCEVSDNDNRRFVYLFQIQKSEYSPHQTDNRYFMRLDTETRIAPHHFVEALFRKIRYPDLKGYLEFMNISFLDKDYQYVLIQFKVVIKNNSPLQNEEYPEFIISSNSGSPLEVDEPWPLKEKTFGMPFPTVHKPLEILYYGKRIETVFKIGLHANDLNVLRNNNTNLKIFLRFGGRYSPLKYSFYSIDLSFFVTIHYDYYQSYPIPKERIESLENKLIADSTFDMEIISNWNSVSSD